MKKYNNGRYAIVSNIIEKDVECVNAFNGEVKKVNICEYVIFSNDSKKVVSCFEARENNLSDVLENTPSEDLFEIEDSDYDGICDLNEVRTLAYGEETESSEEDVKEQKEESFKLNLKNSNEEILCSIEGIVIWTEGEVGEEIYFQNPMNGDFSSDHYQVLQGWTEQEEEDNNNWWKLMRAIDEDDTFAEWFIYENGAYEEKDYYC